MVLNLFCTRITEKGRGGREGRKGREGEGREGKERRVKGREGNGREGKGREGKGRSGRLEERNPIRLSICAMHIYFHHSIVQINIKLFTSYPT